MASPSTFDAARRQMVDQQLRRRGIRARPVLRAMERVPRERFMAPELQDQAYADHAAAIDCGQTISQPYMVGLMTQALELSGAETVLEIGTGSGYQTAILAELARQVVSIERHAELAEEAREVLQDLGYQNVTLVVGDGTLGWPAEAPYDRILVTAAAAQLPPALFEQLAPGGILVIPIGDSSGQVLQGIRKINGQPISEALSGCRFVPFVGAQDVSQGAPQGQPQPPRSLGAQPEQLRFPTGLWNAWPESEDGP